MKNKMCLYLVIIVVVLIFGYSIRASSLEPVPEESAVEVLEVRQPTKQDYQRMVTYCFSYLQEQNISVYNSPEFEYADGDIVEFESSVYADEPVYFSNVLLMRFVSDSHDIVSVIAGIEGAYELSELHLFQVDNSITTLVPNEEDRVLLDDLSTLWSSILRGTSFTDEYFSGSYLYDNISADLKYKNVKSLYSGLGKTDLNLGYFDRCLLQFKADSDTVTVLLRLSQDGKILDIDTL